MSKRNCEWIRNNLVETLLERYDCTALGDGDWLVISPFEYVDSDVIEIRVTFKEGDLATVSDYGSSAGRLLLAGVAVRADRVRRSIRETCRGYDVEISDDLVLFRDVPAVEVGAAIAELAVAMLQIDALRMLGQTPGQPRFDTTLARFLQLQFEFPVVARASVKGATGKRYSLTAQAVLPSGSTFLFQAITKGVTIDRTRSIDHAYRIFSDITEGVQPRNKVAVLADPIGSYDPADLRLLERVATIGTWQEKDRIVEHVKDPRKSSRRLFDDSGLALDYA
jgi:Domain of unknown function DUF1828